MLRRIGDSLSIEVITSWSWIFKKFYVDILGRRIQAQTIVYVQTHIYIGCVMYDLNCPELAGILVVICEEIVYCKLWICG